MPKPQKEQQDTEWANLRDYWSSEVDRWKDVHQRTSYAARLNSHLLWPHFKQGATVLEVGFGMGHYLDLVRKAGATPTGVDIVPEAVTAAAQDGLRVMPADARQLPFPDDQFDFTFSLGVFEHFAGTERAIAEQLRVTKPGSTAVITMPYRWSPYTILLAFWNMSRGRWAQRPASYGKRYSIADVRRILRNIGVKDAIIRPYYVGVICQMPFLAWLHRLGMRHLEGFAPARQFGMMLWIEHQKPSRVDQY
jgi:SAM-dependent methyltransferase